MSFDAYSEWDAAYILGSLSANDRREYERHLSSCASCSAAVAELAVLPGLLATVSLDDVVLQGDATREAPVPATLLPRLVRSVARRRRRARIVVGGAIAVAAAAAAVIALVIPLVLPAQPSVSVALSKVASSPLSANLHLVSETWGTRVDMNCHYGQKPRATKAPPAYLTGPVAYAMFVTDVDGHSMQIATWTAGPGSTVEPSGTTSLAVSRIGSIDIRSVSDGRVLLRGSP